MSAKAASTPPDPSTFEALPGAPYADAFALTLLEPGIDALSVARRAFERSRGWVMALMRVRNALVSVFRLKTGPAPEHIHDAVGFFPLISATPARVVLGLDDRHLDFRLVVDLAPQGEGATRVSVTTLVKPHHAFGWAYLMLVLPFHRLIVPAMLNRTRTPEANAKRA